jgi:outer membrane protein TolC
MSSYLIATILLAAIPPCGPLDLDTALGLAVTRSDEVAIKQAELTSAHADEALARALRIAPSASATVVTGPSPEARGTITDSPNSNRSLAGLRPFGRIDVQVIQPLYTWGRIDAASEAARAGVDAREFLVQDTTNEVQFRVAQLYWGVSLARRLLAVAEDVKGALAQADEHIRQELARGDTDISLADRYRVELFRGVVNGRTAEAQKGLELAQLGLAATLGLPAPKLRLKEAPLDPTIADLPDRDAVLAAALRQRPDLAALGDAILARDAEVKAEKAAAKPQFFAAAQFTFAYAPNRDVQLNPWVHDPFRDLSLGAVLGFKQDLAIPMLSARAQKAMAERATLERQQAGLIRLVEVQVDGALAELKAAQARHVAMQASLGSGKALFRSTGLDFAAGLEDAKTVISSYTLYVESQVQAAQAAYDLVVARARLQLVTGAAPRKGVACELL